MVVHGYRVGPLLKHTVHEIGEDNVASLAASAAYTFFFSLFPLLLFLAPLLSLAGDKQRMTSWILTQLTSTLPPAQVAAFRPVLDKVVFSSNAPGLMSIGLLLAAWSGSNIFGTLMGALNTAYDVKETRSWIHQQIVRLATFVVGIVIMVVSTVVFLKGETIAAWIGNSVHLSGPIIIAWKILQFPTALGGLVLLAFITFYALPNVDQHKGRVLFAALLATGLWIVATLLFRVYINHFPPNPAYGIIGAVIILLTWMYYTMFVILAVGELVSELHHGTGAVAPDRGAVFLGRIVNKGGPGGDAAVTRRA
jgi:membrane protein